MNYIKKKRGWARYSGPRKPIKPIKPHEFLESTQEIIIKEYNFHDLHRGLNEISFEAIMDEINKISKYERILHKNIVISIRHSNVSCGCDDEDCHIDIVISHRVMKDHPNPNYEKQLKIYESAIRVYNKQLRTYEEDLEQWRLWVKQTEQIELENNLKRAHELLKKHGRL